MLLCSLAAWPISTVKAWRARTTRGTSLAFMIVIEIGYACGMASKFVSGNVTYVVLFYAINFAVVAMNIAIYARNRRLDSTSGTA